MSRKKYFVFFLAFLILLSASSCSEEGMGTNISTSTPESTNIPTITPGNPLTVVPTKTTPTPTPLPPMQTQCVDATKNVQKIDLRGVVALEQAVKPQSLDFGFFLLDFKSRNTIKTVDGGIFNEVSPDRELLAYTYRSRDREPFLQVVDSSGKTISDFPFRVDGKLQMFFNWQNPELLRTVGVGKTINDVVITLLNPFTQTHVALKTDWEGAYRPVDPYHDKVADWKFDQKATSRYYVYGANILYDPTLTRVVYPRDGGVVSLVNVETETELASSHFQDWGRLPSWSPNGEYLAIVNREGNIDEFYLISRDGQEFQKVTNFSEEFDFVSIPEYTWSPDNKQIAFWLGTEADEQEDGEQSELAVLDIPSKQVTRLCVQGMSRNAYEPWPMNHPEPVWSPDGRYIMITQWDDPAAPKNYHVLVIDPLRGAVEKISENTAPIGWMVGEP